MVAPRRLALKKMPCRIRRRFDRNARLLLEFARHGLEAGLADFDAAARKMPAGNIAMPDQQDFVVEALITIARTPSDIGRSENEAPNA